MNASAFLAPVPAVGAGIAVIAAALLRSRGAVLPFGATVGVAALGAVAAGSVLWQVGRLARLGPPGAGDAGPAVRLTGVAAERARERAVARSPAGGGGWIHRWRLVLPAIAATASLPLAVALVASAWQGGDVSWYQVAGTARELPAPPGAPGGRVELVAVRPDDPAELLELRITGAPGSPAALVRVPAWGRLEVGSVELAVRGMGPGVALRLLRAGQPLFDGVIPLAPGPEAGTFTDTASDGSLAVTVTVEGWPGGVGEEGAPHVVLREAGAVRFAGSVPVGRPSRGAAEFVVEVSGITPFVELSARDGSLDAPLGAGALLLAAAIAAALTLRPRGYRYGEEADGSVVVSPPEAWVDLWEAGR